MTTQQLIAAARERLSTPRIGKTILREMDRDILIIRRLVEALEAPANGDTSDGHHTFDELYDYRMLYNAHAAHGWAAAGIPVVKSWNHFDGQPCFGGGWFIVTATLSTGQVSNHYRAEYWDLFAVPAVTIPPEWDGHSPADAAARLRHAALDQSLCCTAHGTHATPHRGCILR